ncbi:SIS domain-containing protein [Oceanobacillus sojae]|uniref:Glucosamine--fructose-6-phosphate aminotransferase n=1 Tax=Oceanobacillus sojae TaxID=582851 RepID=A0A511ZHU4_9BACI|nr:SIS domain-containing protein [Oceanobacillus sojae]GEN87007.1 glucosamine--fructose-6-phosphate aminotransferase [Oceanobacillus sojae]
MVSMLDYIYEEQVTLEKIIKEFDFNLPELKDVTHCLILATGSSYNASLAAKYYMESTGDMYIDIQEPFDFLHYGKVDPKFDLVIAVSQSGKSTSTIHAVEKITQFQKIKTITLTSDSESPITKVANHMLNLNMGMEKVGFVTKGYSATVLNLMLLSLAIASQSHRMDEKVLEKEKENLCKAVYSINKIIDKTAKFFENKKAELKESNRFLAIGYGPNWGTAKEFETKFTETVRKPSQGFELEAYMHGPYLEANETHSIFFVETDSAILSRSKALRGYMESHVKRCYVISTQSAGGEDELALDLDVSEKISPLLLVIPFQYFAYQIATIQGIDLGQRIFDDFDQVLQSKI